MKSTVVIVQEHLPAFRIPFYECLRRRLADEGIALRLIFAPNQRNTFVKAGLEWAEPVPIRWFGPMAWQSVLKRVGDADLVVVQQENKYLANPLLQIWSRLGGPAVAYWGHGRNFQKPAESWPGSALKRFLSCRVDWWFAYNELCAEIVESHGFPSERITSVGNAVDTTGLKERRREVTEAEIGQLRRSLHINSPNIAIYTGGLYPNKRIPFLIAAAERIRGMIPDFHLMVIGDGPERHLVRKAAAVHPWIHDLGPKDDYSKVPYWAMAKLLLMPGLVGLVVVDSFALGVPLVTTDYPYHSPEIDYLESGINGLIVPCGEDSSAYAEAIACLLGDSGRLGKLAAGAEASAGEYTIERMAGNFATGIVGALGAR